MIRLGNSSIRDIFLGNALISKIYLGSNLIYNKIRQIKPIASYRCYDKTNEDSDRDLLKDLTGNGYDIKLSNFSFTLGSGYGKYSWRFLLWEIKNTNGEIISNSKFKLTGTTSEDKLLRFVSSFKVGEKFKLRLKISGIPSEITDFRLLNESIRTNIPLSNGINYIETEIGDIGTYKTLYFIGTVPDEINNKFEITVEQIPEYQGALINDGVDDRGICVKPYGVVGTVITVVKAIKWPNSAYLFNTAWNNSEPLDKGRLYCWKNTFGNIDCGLPVLSTPLSENIISFRRDPIESTVPLNLFLNNREDKTAILAFYAMEVYKEKLSDKELEEAKDRLKKEFQEKTGQTIYADGIVSAYEAYDKTNSDSDRDILFDLSGNGHNIKLNNFAYNRESGFGSFPVDLININGIGWSKESFNKIKLYGQADGFVHIMLKCPVNAEGKIKLKFKVTIRNEYITNKLDLYYFYGAGVSDYTLVKEALNNGLHTVEFVPKEGYRGQIVIAWRNKTQLVDLDIEFIPEYNGALVSDGVDDYGICENFPTLTKEKGYTVIALRKFLTKINGGLFVITNDNESEGFIRTNVLSFETTSVRRDYIGQFGALNDITGLFPNLLTYSTSKSYNGKKELLSGELTESTKLYLLSGTKLLNAFAKSATYALEIYDHDLTETEIQSIKERMIRRYEEKTGNLYRPEGLVAAYQTYHKSNEDSNRNILEDLSGNGHDIQLNNFSWALGSGYGKYIFDFTQFTIATTNGVVTKSVTPFKVEITDKTTVKRPLFEKYLYRKTDNVTGEYKIPALKIKVLNENNLDLFVDIYKVNSQDVGNSEKLLDINKSGTYIIPEKVINADEFKMVAYRFMGSNATFQDENIIIEQIPEYKGALISDGIDDYGICKNFPLFPNSSGYTVCAIRKWIDFPLTKICGLISKRTGVGVSEDGSGEFCFEKYGNSSLFNVVYSYGKHSEINISNDEVFSYMTSKAYNGASISKGTAEGIDFLLLFAGLSNDGGITIKEYSKAAIYSVEIYNRDLSEEEIAEVKKKMIEKYEKETGEKYIKS